MGMKVLSVQKDLLLHNLEAVKQLVGVPVIPVLKGNAYGLGDCEVAKILYGAGVRQFACARMEEAERLAAALPEEAEILLLSPYSTQEDAEKIINLNLTAAIGSYDSAVLLNGLAEKSGVTCRVHIKFDTGMGRFGFLPSEADKAVQAVKYLKNLELAGCFSHLSNSFGRSRKSAQRQLALLNECVKTLRDAGVEPGIVHIANSPAALRSPDMRLDAVRIGSALLGRVAVRNRLGLKKVGRLESDITEIRWLPKGHNIGYADTYKTKTAKRIAVIQVGYADGVFVEKKRDTFRLRDILRYGYADAKLLFKKPWLTCEIKGRPARILGRVGFCNVVADVTDIECKPGDIAVFDVNPLYINANVERRYI